MKYLPRDVTKAVAFASLIVSLVSFCDVKTVQARNFFPSTMSEIRDALEEAESNGENDVIVVRAGNYVITSTLSYSPMESDAGKMLFIGSWGGALKPTFRRGMDAGDSTLLTISSPAGETTVADIIFEGARAYGDGGAVRIHNNSGKIRLINNRFIDNESGGAGGGAHLSTHIARIEVFNNIFERNSTTGGGGGGGLFIGCSDYDNMREIKIYNNTFLNNEASKGGGLFIDRHALALVYVFSNIFWGNTGSPRDVADQIEYGTLPYGEEYFECRQTHLWYNQISDYLAFCSRVLTMDFLFSTGYNSGSDPLLDGFIPSVGSPVVDTGPDPMEFITPVYIGDPPPYDYRSKPRVVDGNGDGKALIDRGAIEIDEGVAKYGVMDIDQVVSIPYCVSVGGWSTGIAITNLSDTEITGLTLDMVKPGGEWHGVMTNYRTEIGSIEPRAQKVDFIDNLYGKTWTEGRFWCEIWHPGIEKFTVSVFVMNVSTGQSEGFGFHPFISESRTHTFPEYGLFIPAP